MDLATIISIAGIVGTFITILLVYFTLREMRTQRKAAQKPDLLLPRFTVYGYAVGIKDVIDFSIPRFWSHKESLDKGVIWEDSAPAKVYNVGFAVAKNIELLWQFSFVKTMQQIQDYCYQNSIPIVIQVENERLNITERGVKTVGEMPLSPMNQKFDFLMPVNVTSEGLSSTIPYALRELISTIIYLKIHARKQKPDIPIEFEIPSMRLELDYDDLEDSHYSKAFDVLFSLYTYSMLPSDASETEVHPAWVGSFEFRKSLFNPEELRVIREMYKKNPLRFLEEGIKQIWEHVRK